MKKKIIVLVGFLFVIAISGFIGKVTTVNAISKVELEEIVMKQQATIDALTLQLSETTKRLEALESKESSTEQIETRLTHVESTVGKWDTEMSAIQLINDTVNKFNNRILLLEKFHHVDDASIQGYITGLPQLISNAMRDRIYYDSSCMDNSCTYPIEKESLIIDDPATYYIGSSNYNILNYITEEKIKEITLNAYNQQKSDKVNYKNIKIFIIQPFGQTNKIIEIPLQ